MSKSKASLGILFLTVFIDLVGFGIIIPLSPYLAREFSATPFEIGLLMSVYSLMQFIFSPIWGRVSDKIGRRPIIIMSLLGSTLSYVGFAFSSTLLGLFIARTFAGIFGASVSTAAAYVADITTEENRSKGMGMIGAAFGLGFVFGPAIGGIAGSFGNSIGSAPPFGANFAALIAGGICFFNFLLAIKVLKESLPKEKRGKLKVKESRFKLMFKHLGTPVVGQLLLIGFLITFSMAHMESTLFLFVDDRFGWGMEKASYGFAYVGLLMAFTQGYLIRKLMPKLGERLSMLIGLVMMGLGMIMIGYVGTIAGLAIAVTLLALGNGMANPSVMGSVSLKTDKQEQGLVMGVSHSMSALARIIGPAIGGWVYGEMSIASPFYIAGILSMLGFLVALTIYAKLPQVGKEKTIKSVAF